VYRVHIRSLHRHNHPQFRSSFCSETLRGRGHSLRSVMPPAPTHRPGSCRVPPSPLRYATRRSPGSVKFAGASIQVVTNSHERERRQSPSLSHVPSLACSKRSMERLEDVIAAAIARLYGRGRPRIILAGSNLAGICRRTLLRIATCCGRPSPPVKGERQRLACGKRLNASWRILSASEVTRIAAEVSREPFASPQLCHNHGIPTRQV
jgi:hypothetical protein